MPVRQVPIDEFMVGSFASGLKEPIALEVFPHLGGLVVVPALVAVGQRPGPTLLVAAGVHGDEFEGMAAIRAVFADLDPTELAGSFIGLPVCNPFAYAGQGRASPEHVDGLNLARVFPGDAAGLPTQRLAHRLFEIAVRNLGPDDLFVDLHSAGTRYQYLPMVGYREIPGPALGPSIEAARHFGIERIWVIPGSPGPFNSETARRGIPTVGTEITGQGGCRPEDVALFTAGLRNLLRYRGILPGGPPDRLAVQPLYTTTVFADVAGFIQPRVDLNDQIRAGDPLGEIVDPWGGRLAVLHAPRDGEVWAIRTFSSILAGDIAFLIAHPSPGTTAPQGR
jgi:predicted deacylase